jgi:hypothetical protein
MSPPPSRIWMGLPSLAAELKDLGHGGDDEGVRVVVTAEMLVVLHSAQASRRI